MGITRRVSGDFYTISGATVTYYGSFIVHSPTITITTTQAVAEGLGIFTWSAGAPVVRVTIPRNLVIQPQSPAVVQFKTLTNQNGASYTCAFESGYFRSVDLEQDREVGVTPFVSYNTGLLPSGGAARTLSVIDAYKEAGIELRNTGASNVVNTPPGASWSDAELHDAMEKNFSRWLNIPQWKVWLFHAKRHEMGAGLLGIMFDQKGAQRQGCAVFYDGVGGTTPYQQREQLYCAVHELGHCFNLLHSWQKSYANPPVPNRPTSLSWMNYPWRYPEGEAAFWSRFACQFDDGELVHLRHAFRNNIIMGGSPFTQGSGVEKLVGFEQPVYDESGLQLKLEAPRSFAFGEPVVVELKLYTTDLRGKVVHNELHPNFGFVQLAIQKPNGATILYEPPIDHCVLPELVRLTADHPSIYESAYIGYDRENGQIFDAPGNYKVGAVYYALDGSTVFSDTVTIRVRIPLTREDEEVAELFLGEDQGMVLYLLGTDSTFLSGGTKALDQVVDKHAKHPLAVYAQMIKGYNATRAFKTITPEYEVRVREPRYGEALKMLSAVIDASERDKGVDNITLNMVYSRLALTQASEGDIEDAQTTINRMVTSFQKKALKPHVLQQIDMQADLLRAEVRSQTK
jgi:hypothetical protein